MQLHETHAVADFLREQHLIRQRLVFARDPASERGIKFTGLIPLRKIAAEFSIRLAEIAQHASVARVPRRDDGRLVFIARHGGEIRFGPDVAKIVTTQRRRRGNWLSAEQ